MFSCSGTSGTLLRHPASPASEDEKVEGKASVDLILSHDGELPHVEKHFDRLDETRVVVYSTTVGESSDPSCTTKLWRGITADSGLLPEETGALMQLARAGVNAKLSDLRWAWLFQKPFTPVLDALVVVLRAWPSFKAAAERENGVTDSRPNELSKIGALDRFVRVMRQVGATAFPKAEPEVAAGICVDVLIRETSVGSPVLRLTLEDKAPLLLLCGQGVIRDADALVVLIELKLGELPSSGK